MLGLRPHGSEGLVAVRPLGGSSAAGHVRDRAEAVCVQVEASRRRRQRDGATAVHVVPQQSDRRRRLSPVPVPPGDGRHGRSRWEIRHRAGASARSKCRHGEARGLCRAYCGRMRESISNPHAFLELRRHSAVTDTRAPTRTFQPLSRFSVAPSRNILAGSTLPSSQLCRAGALSFAQEIESIAGLATTTSLPSKRSSYRNQTTKGRYLQVSYGASRTRTGDLLGAISAERSHVA
jgi:hypothetical protein